MFVVFVGICPQHLLGGADNEIGCRIQINVWYDGRHPFRNDAIGVNQTV